MWQRTQFGTLDEVYLSAPRGSNLAPRLVGGARPGHSLAVGSAALLAPVPDFRYVGLEPIPARRVGVAVTAFGLGAGVSLAMSGCDSRHALVAGALASLASAYALRGAGAGTALSSGSARMAIVPWGVLVHTDEAPRILRWAAVRRIEVALPRARTLLSGTTISSVVVVETERDRFVGEAVGRAPLERLVEHLDDYAREQGTPLALDLDGESPAEVLESELEVLFSAARGWLESAPAAARLELLPAGYRRAGSHTPTRSAIDVLRNVLSDRTPRGADPRAFAAVVAAELEATELAAELVALTQCPHPLVAGVAKQAARRLGVARAKTGTLDEVAPFLWEGDRARLEAWVK
jgi:hypothetical protein